MAAPVSVTRFRLILLSLAMGGFAIGTTEFASMSLLPYFAPALGIDEPTAGHVISIYALGVVVGAPILAVLAAKLSRRVLLIGLMLMFALGNGLSAIAPDYHSMLLFRFISGLPHGAYFGVAALTAASVAPRHKRAQAVSYVMMGLTIATVAGVPFANWLGQVIGWRYGFGVVAVLALATALLVMAFAPRDGAPEGASPLKELGALTNRQIWLTLLTGAVGFGGLFAVYTYVATTMMEVTGVSAALVPAVLAVFGVGMTAGNLFAGWAADKALIPTAAGMFLLSASALALYPLAAQNIWTIGLDIFFIGFGGGVGVVLQMRLMDVAGEAQTLAAALHHSAFNVANAIGPWLGGMAIAAGYGWTSTGWVGCALALGGVALLAVTVWDAKRTADKAPKHQGFL
ncbi:MAG: MFS transporter [Sphingobium sp.]|nr:MFS transporter [Sphingobium sp.]